MKKLLSIALVFCLLATVIPVSLVSATSYTSRSDFAWGVNGHNKFYASYPESNLKQQIKLAAELGSKIYRFNFNPTTADDFKYMDTILAEVLAYNMDMMLVLDNADGTNSEIASRIGAVASRYNLNSQYGFIKYLQIFGEADVSALNESNPNGGVNGSSTSHYTTAVINKWYDKFSAAINAVKAVNTNSKIAISISHVHYGFLTALKNKGLNWDINGLDWYGDMGSFSTILSPMKSNFTQDIIITETNIRPTGNNANDPYTTWNWLLTGMSTVYSDTRVKGMIFYELYDEPTITDPVEAYCGLVSSTISGDVIKLKSIYTQIQSLIGGGARSLTYPVNPPTPPVSNTNLKTIEMDITGDSALLGNGGVNPGFQVLGDALYNENLGSLDLSKADNIEFDFYVSDYSTLISVMNGSNGAVNGIDFCLGSTSGSRYATREGAQFISQITGSGWNHIVLPKTAFGNIGSGVLNFSSVNTWMVNFTGNNIFYPLGTAANITAKCANICATITSPVSTKMLDTSFKSYLIPSNAAYSWLWDNLYSSGLAAVNLSDSENIEFDFYVSNYPVFSARLTGGYGASDIRISIGSDSGNRYNNRVSNSFLSQITQTGWNHIKLSKQSFYMNSANGQQPNWSAITTWSCYFEGSSVTSQALMSGLTLGVRNVSGSKISLPAMPANVITNFANTINQTFENGATFNYMFDRTMLEGMSPAVNFTQGGYIQFDVFVSNYSILRNAPGDIRIDFTSGANRWSNRIIYDVTSQIIGSGWSHVKIPVSSYIQNAGDLTAIKNIMFYREGNLDASITGLNIILGNFCITN